MGYPHKIVTCCYCGTRAALILKGNTQHELACSRCGAPLHDLKMLPKAREGDRELVDPMPQRTKPKYVKSQYVKSQYAKPRKPKKKRKGLLHKVFEEAFDIIEDIFD